MNNKEQRLNDDQIKDSLLFALFIGAILGERAGKNTAFKHFKNPDIGSLVGALYGTVATFISEQGGAFVAGGISFLISLLIYDSAAYFSYGVPFSPWEDYIAFYILGGFVNAYETSRELTDEEFKRLEFEIDVILVSILFQVDKLGTSKHDINWNKLKFDLIFRTLTHRKIEKDVIIETEFGNIFFNPFRSIIRGFSKGYYLYFYENQLYS